MWFGCFQGAMKGPSEHSSYSSFAKVRGDWSPTNAVNVGVTVATSPTITRLYRWIRAASISPGKFAAL